MPPMDERDTADDLKLSVKVLSDSCFRETTTRPGLDDEDEPIKDIQLWNRKRCLSRSDANNVFLYDSQAGSMRVIKHVRWQDNKANYQRELGVMKRVLMGVKPHEKDFFVDFLGWFPSPEYMHFVLEYCPFGDISQQPRPVSELKARLVCSQLMEGLAVLHHLDITHRDIKPENVLVVSQDPIRVKIADFGISKISQRNGTQPRTNGGSVGYLAPERYGINNHAAESAYTQAVDIWSLGCLIYYILTDEVPFMARENEITPSVNIYQALLSYCNGYLGFPEGPLSRQRVSLSGRYFIQKLLSPIADDRPKASGQVMKDWQIPQILGEQPITRESTTSNLNEFPTNMSNSLTSSLQSDIFGIPDLIQRDMFGDEDEMDLHSSDLWNLMRQERRNQSVQERLRILLMSNAKPNVFFKGCTALHLAAENGSVESVQTLLEHRADATLQTNPRQETAIHLATSRGELESFAKKYRCLVSRDADIDAQNWEGDTALHLVIQRLGTVDAVKILLDSKAAVDIKGRQGRTPLQYAIALGKEEIAMVLLDYKADPDCTDNDGASALHISVRSKRATTKLLEKVIESGADINKKDKRQQTPLFEALKHGNIDLVPTLAEHGAICNPHSPELEKRLKKVLWWKSLRMPLPWLSR